MNANEISFENLPRAVGQLLSEVAELKQMVSTSRPSVTTPKRTPLGIEDACRIIGKAKPTVYTLVRKRLLPCYKNGKKLYFFEDELLDWIVTGKKKTLREIRSEAETDVRRRNQNRIDR